MQLIQMYLMISLFAGVLCILFYKSKKTENKVFEYKIIELSPYTFEIRILRTYYKGFLWWRKRAEKLVESDCSGYPLGTPHKVIGFDGKYYKMSFPRSGRFTNHFAADRAVERFKNKISHEEKFN